MITTGTEIGPPPRSTLTALPWPPAIVRPETEAIGRDVATPPTVTTRSEPLTAIEI